MLRPAKGDMYPFIDFTWNAIKGECPHECSYCYMKRWGKQPSLHFDEKEMKTDLGKGNFIFVGSSCDMFADSVKSDWIYEVMERCCQFDNTYLFQTRNASRLYEFDFYDRFPSDYFIATTLETNREAADILTKAPSIRERCSILKTYKLKNLIINIEPVIDFDLCIFANMIARLDPVQVSIGADSRRTGLPEPPKEKLLELIAELEKFTKVVLKKNLGRLLK